MEKRLTIILSPKKLRFYRKAQDKKQYEIADLIGVERTTYVGYEKRQVLELAFSVAEKIAKYLKVDVSDLEQPPEGEKVSQKVEEGINLKDKQEVKGERPDSVFLFMDTINRLIAKNEAIFQGEIEHLRGNENWFKEEFSKLTSKLGRPNDS